MALKKVLLFLACCVLYDCDQVVGFGSYDLVSLEQRPYIEALMAEALCQSIECDGSACATFVEFLNKNKTLLSEEDRAWLVPMIDSWPKFPSGILGGNVVDFGSFDECFSIGTDVRPNSRGVKGQYCSFAINVIVGELTLSFATCIPDSAKIYSKNITITDNIMIGVTGKNCQTSGAYNKFEGDDWAAVAVFGIILIIICISTVYDFWLHYTDTKTINPLFIAFSLVTNSKKLFSTSNAPGQIQSLHGIRAISLMWIIAGHRYVSAAALPSANILTALEFKDSQDSAYISSARAAVDTFFLFSAFLVSFLYLKGVRSAISKAEAKGTRAYNPMTWAKIPIYYVHRILRVTPALAAVFFVQITLFRRIGEGPLWPLLNEMFVTTCSKWWWSLFLYVQNYVNYKEMCIVPSWYLSADMQLFLLSPLLIIPIGDLYIKGKKTLAYYLVLAVIAVSIIVPMTVEFFREFDKDNIYETHHRTSVYTIGILFGMIMIDCQDKKIRINPFVNIILWGISLGAMIAIIITMHTTEAEPDLVKNNIFFSLSRPVWSAAICWIVFTCHYGYGGPVNWLLSLPIFQVMTKLSFSMYLLHNLLITFSLGTSKVPGHFSEYEVMYMWSGDYIFTIAVSIVWVLCFESPIVGIEKVLFGGGSRATRPAPPAEKASSDKIEEGVAGPSK